jgi:hypothetical protein
LELALDPLDQHHSKILIILREQRYSLLGSQLQILAKSNKEHFQYRGGLVNGLFGVDVVYVDDALGRLGLGLGRAGQGLEGGPLEGGPGPVLAVAGPGVGLLEGWLPRLPVPELVQGQSEHVQVPADQQTLDLRVQLAGKTLEDVVEDVPVE